MLNDIEQTGRKIERIREEFKDTGRKLLEAYFERIQELYSDETLQRDILKGLENLITNPNDHLSAKGTTFDGTTARKIRLRLGITSDELAKELGYKNIKAGRSQIGQIEQGTRKIGYPPRGGPLKYLLWLREQGYNPLEL